MFKFLAFIALAAAACTNGATPPAAQQGHQAPPPGRTQLMQLYYMADADALNTAPYGLPDIDALSQALNARLFAERVSSLAEAKERMLVWSARPMDVLVLASSLAEQAWDELKLPKVREIRILRVQTKEVDSKAIERFKKAFAAPAPGRKIYVGSHVKSYFDVAGKEPVFLQVLVKWNTALEEAIRKNTGPDTLKLSFSNGFLEIKKGPEALALGEAEQKKLDESLNQFRMEELANP